MMKTYARVDSSVIVEIILPWTNGEGIPVDIPIEDRFPAEFIATLVDITGLDPMPIQGWTYEGGVFSEPQPDPVDLDQLAITVRNQRDYALRSIYDPGILMAQRALRMAASPEESSYAEGKIAELDAYAEALTEIPEQAGFPQTIVWPVAPTR
jgi:hypothetical protein